jgi:hypothetical protein
MPFKEPCDNCAFRPGSPESKDRDGWKALMESLKSGGKFFCHKGVPIKQGKDSSFKSFEYPMRPLKTESCGPIEVHDQDSMRMCRGYLNAWIVWTRRKYAESWPSDSATTMRGFGSDVESEPDDR